MDAVVSDKHATARLRASLIEEARQAGLLGGEKPSM
jgi:hypothetical protein